MEVLAEEHGLDDWAEQLAALGNNTFGIDMVQSFAIDNEDLIFTVFAAHHTEYVCVATMPIGSIKSWERLIFAAFQLSKIVAETWMR